MIKLLKSGNWALEGVNVVEVVEGEVENFGSVENCKLVDAGWAEWAKDEVKAQENPVNEGKLPRNKVAK